MGYKTIVIDCEPRISYEDDPTIDMLRVGETGYIIPWAAKWVNGKVVRIKPNARYSSRPSGTRELKVTRDSLTQFTCVNLSRD